MFKEQISLVMGTFYVRRFIWWLNFKEQPSFVAFYWLLNAVFIIPFVWIAHMVRSSYLLPIVHRLFTQFCLFILCCIPEFHLIFSLLACLSINKSKNKWKCEESTCRSTTCLSTRWCELLLFSHNLSGIQLETKYQIWIT